MTNDEAIVILINAAAAANQRGVFTLGDSKKIIEAITLLKPEVFEEQTEVVN
jgi:hypothetical protein